MLKYNIKRNDGTTLLELMVSIAIFSSMIIVISGIFNGINRGQREAIASQNIQESVRYFMEVASKEIRMAKGDIAGMPCPTGGKTFGNGAGDQLLFQNKDDQCVTYEEIGGQIWVTRDADSFPVTSSAILVSNLSFLIDDDAIGVIRTKQAKVTMSFDVESKSDIDTHKNPMRIQTTISSRRYE